MKPNPLKLRHVLLSRLPFPRISPKPIPTLLPLFHTPQTPTPNPSFPIRLYHFTPPLSFSLTQNDAVPISQQNTETEEEDETLNEFLSRFAHKMRAHLSTAYPHCDKQTVDAMLGIIIEKVLEQSGGSGEGEARKGESELSQDLWRTVEEVSASVYTEMEKERNKERMKLAYLTDEGVKAMTRFASEVGVRGDLLRELRFKWAKEAIGRQDFYESLEQYREEEGEGVKGGEGGEVKKREVELRRKGKVKYSVYGLDLSGEEWREVSEKVHEAEEMLEVKEKEMTGKAKTVTDMIVGFGKEVEEEEIRKVVSEWVELVSPRKVDWVVLFGKVKNKDVELYLKVAELVLGEPSFQADVRDYSKLIDIHAKENRSEAAERILQKMNENGIQPDIITLTTLVHMYSKIGHLEKAKQAFDTLNSHGFKPDSEVYRSLILAYIKAGQPRVAEGLQREMDTRGFQVSEDIYMALLKAFAQQGDNSSVQKIVLSMQFQGFQPTLEYCALLVEASAKAGRSDEARAKYDELRGLGYKPDDKCTSFVISAYQNKKELDKALNFLLKLEKEGYEPGVHTYAVLVDWLGKLQLVDEVERILGKIAQLGEAPPFNIQVSLCEMYAAAGVEKKALQALGILEAKKELLTLQDFVRVVQGLVKGGFTQEAQRILKLAEAQGFKISDSVSLRMVETQAYGGLRHGMR